VEFRKPADGRQEVVEVVGNASRKPADRLHLLSLGQLCLALTSRDWDAHVLLPAIHQGAPNILSLPASELRLHGPR
jgi:hypothetical protein